MCWAIQVRLAFTSMGKATNPVPDVNALGDLAAAAARTARSHLTAAEHLLDGGFWPQARAFAVLALEEAGKALLCTTAMLAPEQVREYFPFGDLSWDHVGKLGVGHSIGAFLSFVRDGDNAPVTAAQALAELENLARDDNEGKQLGLYADYRDGTTWEPARVTEDQACRIVGIARDALDNGGPLIDAVLADALAACLPPSVCEFQTLMLNALSKGEPAVIKVVEDELAKMDALAGVLADAPADWLSVALKQPTRPDAAAEDSTATSAPRLVRVSCPSATRGPARPNRVDETRLAGRRELCLQEARRR